MTGSKLEFQAFLEEEVSKVRGIAVPLRSGLLRRALVRKVRIRKLHPNPNDEFCVPEIGPNYDIIFSYEKHFRMASDKNTSTAWMMVNGKLDPLMVERIRPDGYLILNGHHRWAAALRAGRRTLSVRLVNPVEEKEIRRVLSSSVHEKRITLDLDEVVLPAGRIRRKSSCPFPSPGSIGSACAWGFRRSSASSP